MKYTAEELRKELVRLARGNEEFVEFSRRIMNTGKAILGVRTPDLRRLAKSVAREAGVEDISLLLDEVDGGVYEEVLLVGLVMSYARLGDAEKIRLTDRYLKLADCWALIDMYAAVWRRKYDRGLWWDYSLLCLKSDAEFVVRFGVMNLMSNYLDEEYFERALTEVRKVRHDGYYVRMGLAWLYATAAVRDYGRAMRELEVAGVDDWVRRKAYTKMLESYRMSFEQKEEIREARGKLK